MDRRLFALLQFYTVPVVPERQVDQLEFVRAVRTTRFRVRFSWRYGESARIYPSLSGDPPELSSFHRTCCTMERPGGHSTGSKSSGSRNRLQDGAG